jgi:molybdopterin-guanine dinucleotide biosynthesis protein A
VEWAAVILAGGTSRRWGGRDKTASPLAGRPVLRHVVDAVLPDAAALVVVAPSGHPAQAGVTAAALDVGCPLRWTREDPPGGGPTAGLAAGLAALDALVADGALPDGVPPAVVVLAGDLPFARTALPRLLAALDPGPGPGPGVTHPDVALGLDPDGHRQPLLAVHRTDSLRRRLAGLDPSGAPLRTLLTAADVVEVPVTAHESLDLDTPDDAERAERALAVAVDTGAVP